MSLPLSGVTVLALEQAIAAPLCTRHLADLGARVIKVERPEVGDFSRDYDHHVPGTSAWSFWVNRGKESLALDLKSEGGMRVVRELLERVDVLVHNLGPGATDRLGLAVADLRKRYPRLVICGISGYGLDGPLATRKAYDLLLQGETAMASVSGTPEQPAKIGVSIADISGAMYALSAVLAALYQRALTGEGAIANIALFDTCIEWMSPHFYSYLYAGVEPVRAGTRHHAIVPYGPFAVRDGVVNIAVQNEREWVRLCSEVLMRPDLAEDPRYAGVPQRLARRAELEPLVGDILSRLSLSEAAARLDAADLPWGEFREVRDLPDHPNLRARRLLHEVDGPEGPLQALRHPLQLEGMEDGQRGVPRIGEHNAAILAELGLGPATLD